MNAKGVRLASTRSLLEKYELLLGQARVHNRGDLVEKYKLKVVEMKERYKSIENNLPYVKGYKQECAVEGCSNILNLKKESKKIKYCTKCRKYRVASPKYENARQKLGASLRKNLKYVTITNNNSLGLTVGINIPVSDRYTLKSLSARQFADNKEELKVYLDGMMDTISQEILEFMKNIERADNK